jgi:hypothetical protein
MTRYLTSFDAHAMDHIPDEDVPDDTRLRERAGMSPRRSAG